MQYALHDDDVSAIIFSLKFSNMYITIRKPYILKVNVTHSILPMPDCENLQLVELANDR